MNDQSDQNRKRRKSLEQMQIEALQHEGLGGLHCSQCGCNNFKVTQSWILHGVRKRIRRCRNCGMPMTTMEMSVDDNFDPKTKR